MKESHIRSLVKGVSWRIIGTTDTIIIATVIMFLDHTTDYFQKALTIGAIEFCTKILLYYLHERVWLKLKMNFHIKSLSKAVSWRGVAFFDTWAIATFVTHAPWHAAQIAGIELFTKIPVFYLHERLWRMIKWGQTIEVTPNMEAVETVNA